MKALILLALLGVGGYFAWKYDWPSKPLRESGAQLERHLNRELSGAGVSDGQIVAQVHRERARLSFIRWLETDREVSVDSLARAQSLADTLARTSDRDGFSSEKDTLHGSVLLDVKRFGLRFQRIFFIPSKR
jgi:hypothetical protein